MVRELRDLWFVVYRCSAAIEMPDVIRARDELIRRFVSTALSEPEVESSPTPDLWTPHDDDELPLYCGASVTGRDHGEDDDAATFDREHQYWGRQRRRRSRSA
jgi:hypothetical protein